VVKGRKYNGKPDGMLIKCQCAGGQQVKNRRCRLTNRRLREHYSRRGNQLGFLGLLSDPIENGNTTVIYNLKVEFLKSWMR